MDAFIYKSQEGNPSSFLVKEREDHFQVEQDLTPYLEAAQQSRQQQWDNRLTLRKSHWRPFATIPDIVAIDILTKYKLDIHDPAFSHDPTNGPKLRQIIRTEYPHLLLSHGV